MFFFVSILFLFVLVLTFSHSCICIFLSIITLLFYLKRCQKYKAIKATQATRVMFESLQYFGKDYPSYHCLTKITFLSFIQANMLINLIIRISILMCAVLIYIKYILFLWSTNNSCKIIR